jgi:hypothetical protein
MLDTVYSVSVLRRSGLWLESPRWSGRLGIVEVDLVAGRSGHGVDGRDCILDLPGRTEERWELAHQGGEAVFGTASALCYVGRCRTFRSVSDSTCGECIGTLRGVFLHRNFAHSMI